jgi:hypothetical protein
MVFLVPSRKFLDDRVFTIYSFYSFTKSSKNHPSIPRYIGLTSAENAGNLGFVVLTTFVMKSSTFWDITPCSPLKVN